jgi:hypothetical protein
VLQDVKDSVQALEQDVLRLQQEEATNATQINHLTATNPQLQQQVEDATAANQQQMALLTMRGNELQVGVTGVPLVS